MWREIEFEISCNNSAVTCIDTESRQRERDMVGAGAPVSCAHLVCVHCGKCCGSLVEAHAAGRLKLVS